MIKRKMQRRDFLALSGLLGAGVMLSACQPQVVEKIVKETVVVEKEKEKIVKETVVVEKQVEKKVEVTKVVEKVVEKVKEVGLKDVPREKTLILMFGGNVGQFPDASLGNVYGGLSHQNGVASMLEPLAYYCAFAAKEILWLAESYQYNPTYTELTIKVRKGAEWSDGVPFTAKDVAFTINMLVKNAPKLRDSAPIKEWVKEAVAADDYTCKITFSKPNPRFFYDYLSFKFDTGDYLVPEHIFKDVEDPSTFTYWDPAKGWPVNTGPYKLTLHSQTQRFFDRRDDWWAAKIGFAKLPEVERIVVLPSPDESRMIQSAIAGIVDCEHLSVAGIKEVVEKNPKVITHSGREKPYGYIDWWPLSMGFNDLEEPFKDPNIRWAVSYALDRKQICEVGYLGAAVPTPIPYPDYAPLRKYRDSIADLLEKYPSNEFSLAKSAERMQGAGWAKGSDGFWAKGGKKFALEVGGFAFMGEFGPILAEQLQKAGFDAKYTQPADLGDRLSQGKIDSFLYGNGGSIADPYLTLNLYHGRYVRPTGESIYPAWRWKNDAYDAIVDEMATVPMGDPRLVDLFHKAMEIFLKELPALPLFQFYHRMPMNTEYWTNWPTDENNYVNEAWWHLTFPVVLMNLKSTKK